MQLLHLPPKFIFWNCRETRSHFESRPKIVNIHGYFELREPIRTRENYYPLIWWILNPDIHSFKGILFPEFWTPESGKNFFMKAGILSFGIRNTAQWIQIPLTIGIRNPIFTDKIQYMCTLNPEPAAWESRIETVLDSLIGTSYVPKHNVTTIL